MSTKTAIAAAPWIFIAQASATMQSVSRATLALISGALFVRCAHQAMGSHTAHDETEELLIADARQKHNIKSQRSTAILIFIATICNIAR